MESSFTFMIDSKIIVFDIETTEAKVGVPEIVEIGAVKLDISLSQLDSFSELVRPNDIDSFSEFSENLTGIDKDKLHSAETFESVWERWAKFTEYKKIRLFSWGTLDPFVLRMEYSKRRLGYPHNDMPICIASMVYLWASIRGWRPKGFSLANTCRELGIRRDESHRALPDAIDAASVLKEILKPSESRDEPFRLYEV